MTSLVAGIPPVPHRLSHLSHTTSRTQPATNTDYTAVPLADSDVEMLIGQQEFKAEEAVDNGNGILSLVEPTPQRRPAGEGPYEQSDPTL